MGHGRGFLGTSSIMLSCLLQLALLGSSALKWSAGKSLQISFWERFFGAAGRKG